MNRMPHWTLLLLALVLSSCKTASEIRREQMVDNLSLQMVQNQNMTADATVRLQAIEERINMLTGQVEEQEYQTIQQTQEELKALKDRLKLIEENTRNQSKDLDSIKTQLQDQKKFMDELMKTLNSLTKAKKAKPKASPYEEAMEDYQKGRYAQARVKLEALLNQNKVKGAERSRTLHNLGIIAWMDKEDEKAQVYFSKLITEHPDASQVRNGMLFLGKSFSRANQKAEARAILEELIKRFPDANQVPEARKVLARL